MALRDSGPRLIVNADDFGRSSGINEAVIRAHTGGILTTASLMVGEPVCEEAVALARRHPRLGVGLHLALTSGRSVLGPEKIPGLVDSAGNFSDRPAAAGFRYFARRDLHRQLRAEIRAQFEAFRNTGLPLDHVNGHQHLHLHPVLFRMVLELADEFGIRRMRLTRDPFWLNARLAAGHWLDRGAHAFIYAVLSARARASLRRRGIRHTRRVFGLLQNARVDEEYVLRLLGRLPPGDSELYSHPSLDEFKPELDALVSDRVKEAVQRRGIRLIRYRDL